MRALRIAWDNALAGRDKAGTGVYAARLLQQLERRSDVQIEVLEGWRRNLSTNGLITRGLGTLSDLFWTHAYLPTILSKRSTDLLHSPAFVAPVASSVPVVVTIHDVTYRLFPSHFSQYWVNYMKFLMPLVMHSAAAIICPSEHSKQDVVTMYDMPSNRVHTVPYGIDHERFHPLVSLDSKWAHSFNICPGYLLHVGTLSYRKNIPTLLRAVASLRARGRWENRQVVLAGGQSRGIKGAGEILAMIQELDLTEEVVLAGHVPDEIVPGLYAGASIMVMPSLYEGFGFPVLESMAVGTPVIASNSSSLPEVAAGASLLFPAHDERALAAAIEDVLSNHSVAGELRAKGLKRASEFSWKRTADATVLVYRQVIS